MLDQLRMFAREDWLRRNVDLYVGVQRADKWQVLTNYTFRDVEDGIEVPQAAKITLTREAAQDLLDQLIRMGITPSNGIGSPAQVEAMQEHIKDLRRMTFEVRG